ARSVFFFFQAEDGIRDRNVTGVQTCALPIWKTSNVLVIRWYLVEKTSYLLAGSGILATKRRIFGRKVIRGGGNALPLERIVEPRSEERRVGKEGRARGL